MREHVQKTQRNKKRKKNTGGIRGSIHSLIKSIFYFPLCIMHLNVIGSFRAYQRVMTDKNLF